MFTGDYLKAFEQLHTNKIQGWWYEELEPYLYYFFCFGNKFVFIKKFRKRYFVCCSCQCDFDIEQHQSVFEIYRKCNSLESAIFWYKFAIKKILEIK